MFGLFYVASPDFELENFTVPELVTIAIELCQEEGIVNLPNQQKLLQRVAHVKSGKDFFAALDDTPCEGIDKGYRWGAALMKYALNNEKLPSGHKKQGKVRQVVEIARTIFRARQSGYLSLLESSRVDPETGGIVPRSPQ